MSLDKNRKTLLENYIHVLLNACNEKTYRNIGGWREWQGIKPHSFQKISERLIDAIEKVIAMDEIEAKQALEKQALAKARGE